MIHALGPKSLKPLPLASVQRCIVLFSVDIHFKPILEMLEQELFFVVNSIDGIYVGFCLY